ncbi:MAG: glycine cleavage T C-terminal barrel domain-containing protein, partial [Clostridia bacterium]|nr:glycine cleavage T C-terminal barrel domain-containing protein [Clostridia bacterium]
ELLGKGIPRGDYKVQKDGNAIGYVTTGYMAPTLKKSLGLALVDSTCSEIGENIDVMIRGKAVKAVIIETPFYSKNYKK